MALNVQIGDICELVGMCPNELRGKIGKVLSIDPINNEGIYYVYLDNGIGGVNMRGLRVLPKCLEKGDHLTVRQFAEWLLARPNQDALVLYRSCSENNFLGVEEIAEVNGIFLDKEATVMKVRPEWWDKDVQGELPQPIDVLILPGN
jgi:hypothetical protein